MTTENRIWKEIRDAMSELDSPGKKAAADGHELENRLAEVIGLARSIAVTSEEMLRMLSEGVTAPNAGYVYAFEAAPEILDATRRTLMALLSSMQAS